MKVLGDYNLNAAEGDPSVLGATVMGRYVNYAVAVPGVSEVVLHVYEGDAKQPLYSVVLGDEEHYGDIFSVKLADTARNRTYLYEAKGETFLDPYSKLVLGRGSFGHRLSAKERKMLRSPVHFTGFSWQGDRHPSIPYSETVIYKLHVRGFSMTANVAHKGTYLGVAEKAEYLKELGITAVLLMPCTEFNEIEEPGIREGVPAFRSTGFYRTSPYPKEEEEKRADRADASEPRPKVNFWGYTSHYFFFAPKAGYASVPERADAEFKTMIRKLHTHGIEVLMEMNIPSGTNRSMLIDALRFWVKEYHVDGFRINLEQTDPLLLAGDPYLSGAKLIGSGWNIPVIYPKDAIPSTVTLAECNDGFQTDVRRFLKSDEGMAGAFAGRVIRHPEGEAVINYITDHNGFTLNDLYMYDVKHNEENGENGRDGSDYNYSWNCGAEGPDRRRRLRELRLRMKKNALLTMFLSQGVPMLLAGDEFGNTQEGNNNAYCQDNPIGWLSWKEARKNTELTAFIRELTAFRAAHPAFHNVNPFKGTDYLSCGCPDVSVHSRSAWRTDESPYNRSVGILLGGEFAVKNRTEHDDSFYLAYNMYWEEQEFEIPLLSGNRSWKVALTTASEKSAEGVKDARLVIPPRTIVVLQSEEQNVKKERKRKKETGKTGIVERSDDGEDGNGQKADVRSEFTEH